jgi:hypothetical protein
MFCEMRNFNQNRIPTIIAATLGVVIFSFVSIANAQRQGPTRAPVADLPSNLFVTQAPANAIGVAEARQKAQEGKSVVIRGRVGGIAKPIADKMAMFVIADLSLGMCKDGCADFCQVPREELLSKMAAVQVVDNSGKPLRVAMEGTNGLKPLAEVVVQGTVGKLDKNVLVVNAQNIFVQAEKK